MCPDCREHRIRRLSGEDWRTVNVDGMLVTQKPSISRYESFCFVKESGQHTAIYIRGLSSKAEILVDSVHFVVDLRCFIAVGGCKAVLAVAGILRDDPCDATV